MPIIYIMSGLPFSGKSTLSKKMAEKLGISRISFDETWIQIENGQEGIPGSSDIEKWKFINRMCEENARKLLSEGLSVVYDNLGSSFEQRDKIRMLAREKEADSKVIYLEVDKEEVIRRREANLKIKQRAQVSDENFNKALETFESPRESEDYLRYSPSQDMEVWIDTKLMGRSGNLETVEE